LTTLQKEAAPFRKVPNVTVCTVDPNFEEEKKYTYVYFMVFAFCMHMNSVTLNILDIKILFFL